MRILLTLLVCLTCTCFAQSTIPDGVTIDAPSAVSPIATHDGALMRNGQWSQSLYVPRTPQAESSTGTHKFFDRTNVMLSVLTFAGSLTDGITTQHLNGVVRTEYVTVNGVRRPQLVRYEEKNPIAAPFVNAGWPGQLAGTAVMVGADLGVRAWLHKTDHHKLERIVPFVFAGVSAGFAAHNARNW